MDTLKRQSDVDPRSVKLDRDKNVIVFTAAEKKSLNLDKIYEGLKETRMSGKPPGRATRAEIHYLELTATGEIAIVDGDPVLKVTGTMQQFALNATPEDRVLGTPNTPFKRLQAALSRGEKVVSVTGRVKGWSGHFPAVLKALPDAAGKPPTLYVTDFQTAKPN